METAEQRKAAFNKAFVELLEKFGAEFLVGDDGKSYGMHSGTATISMPSVYNEKTDELEKDYCDFLLDGYLP